MGNDDLFARISSGGKCLKLVCDNTNNAIAITTFQSKQWIYWNKKMEKIFGQGFHRKTWTELSPSADELQKDVAMCEDVINNVLPEDFYFIKKHYTNHLTGDVWFADCEFYHIGAIEIEGSLQDVFLCIIRKIEQAMDPKEQTQAVKAELIEQLKASLKPLIKPVVGFIGALLVTATGLITSYANKEQPKVEAKDLAELFSQYVKQYTQSTNSFE